MERKRLLTVLDLLMAYKLWQQITAESNTGQQATPVAERRNCWRRRAPQVWMRTFLKKRKKAEPVFHPDVNSVEENTCGNLFHGGQFTEAADAVKWIPHGGCTLHNYTTRQAHQCFIKRSSAMNNTNFLSFMGDSRIRAMYLGVTNLLQGAPTWKFTYINNSINLKMECLWLTTPEDIYKHLDNWDSNYGFNHPDFILSGSALHTLKNNYHVMNVSASLSQYKDGMQNVVESFHRLKNKTKIIWQLQDPVKLINMIRGNRDFANNDILNIMNDIAVKSLANYNETIYWSSNRLVAHKFIDETFMQDGFHSGEKAIELDVQILMNYLCNQYMDDLQPGTCCSCGV